MQSQASDLFMQLRYLFEDKNICLSHQKFILFYLTVLTSMLLICNENGNCAQEKGQTIQLQ